MVGDSGACGWMCMGRRRLVLVVVFSLFLVVPFVFPLFLSGVLVGSPLGLGYGCVGGFLAQRGVPVYVKDTLFSGYYSNLSTVSPLVFELSGVPRIDGVNFSLSNIVAPNYTIRIAESSSNFESLMNQKYAMSFNLSQNCYLYNVSLYLVSGKTPPIYVDFAIYNATWNQTSKLPEPDEAIYSVDNYDLSSQLKLGWKTIDIMSLCGLLHLNLSSTENGTFFIVLSQDSGKELVWGYNSDEGNGYGSAYNLTSGTEFLSVDFSMRVYLSATNFTTRMLPFPSEINLKINGVNVTDSGSEGGGFCSITGDFGSSNLVFNFSSTWFDTVSFNANVTVSGVNLYPSILLSTLLSTLLGGYTLGSFFETQKRNTVFLTVGIIGAVAVSGVSFYRVEKRRRVPINAMRNMESIIVDHNPTGTMVWSFDFISMQQDVTLVSGFMSAIKTFLEEMKIGGLKRLSTEFGTFIREETKMLTATCIAGEMGLDEEIWIRGKLHEFLVRIEQNYYKELEGWKGDVAQFREAFPNILASLINLGYVQRLQRQKMEKLSGNRDKLQRTLNSYGAKLEELKSRYDSGELDFKKYIIERYKTEAKYDKVQKEYLYAGLFLSRTSSLLERRVKPKNLERIEKIQSRFLEVRKEIEALERKELKGTITSEDITLREKLQKELVSLIEKLDKLKE